MKTILVAGFFILLFGFCLPGPAKAFKEQSDGKHQDTKKESAKNKHKKPPEDQSPNRDE